jgi:2-polyprenyl-3-methyl-5-hydroxy-6-metoxy-1,4-benzoquinol methylase
MNELKTRTSTKEKRMLSPSRWKRLKLGVDRFVADLLPVGSLREALPAPATRRQRARRAIAKLLARPERLSVPLIGNIAFQMVRTAYELQLFAYLKDHPGCSPRQVREALGLTEHSCDVLLVGLGSLGLIRRIEDELYNDPYLERIVQPEFNDGFFVKWLAFNEHLVRPASEWLLDSVRQDRPVGLYQTLGAVDSFYQAISHAPEKLRVFDDFMKAVTSLNKDQVAATPAFASFRSVLDVGGSSGSLAIALAEHHPELRVTVFDFPGVVALARRNFDQSPHAKRLHTIGGNLLEDGIPRGFDCITLCHMFGVFGEERSIQVLRRAYEALEPGNAVCVYTPVLDEDEDGPVSTGVFGSYFLFLANGHGRFFSPARIRTWLTRAGFKNLRTFPLPAHEALFFGYK